MLQTIKRIGNSLVLTIPKLFTKQNHLQEGSVVEVSLEGSSMTVNTHAKRRYNLEELLAEMPDGKLPSVVGWDAIPPAGLEADVGPTGLAKSDACKSPLTTQLKERTKH